MNSKLRSTLFWSSLISAILILIQILLPLFGLDLAVEVSQSIMISVNSILGILALGGVLVNTGQADAIEAKFVSNAKIRGKKNK